MRTSTPKYRPTGKLHPRIAPLYAFACAATLALTVDNESMRVIAGTHRSRQLVAPRGTGTRPTSDRLRETLFNILSPRIPGCRFADLYAGTGAVGIEALSRGAQHVYFTEKSEPALAAIRANLKALHITHGFTIEDRGTGALLERLAKAGVLKGRDFKGCGTPRLFERAGLQSRHKSPNSTTALAAEENFSAANTHSAASSSPLLDIVYLDPPWEAEAEYASTLHLLGSARGRAILVPDALIVAEHNSKSQLAAHYGELTQTRTLKQGDAALTFFAVNPANV
jgi:16S rRNA (guanine966-N2)-methyltransferase